MSDRYFPILRSPLSANAPESIPWSVAEKAWSRWSARFGAGITLDRIAERGGFSVSELDMFYPNWRRESDELFQLRHQVRSLENKITVLASGLEKVIRDGHHDGTTSELETLLQWARRPIQEIMNGLASGREM